MVCKKCGYEDSKAFEICPNCDTNSGLERSAKVKPTRINDNGKTFILVNFLLIIGYNLLYFLLVGRVLHSPWGDIGYVFYGVIILGIIQLVVNIYLWLMEKTNGFLVIFATIFSVSIFILLTRLALNI